MECNSNWVVHLMFYSLPIVVCVFLLGLSVGALLNALLRRNRIHHLTAQFEAELNQQLTEKLQSKGFSSSQHSMVTRSGYDA